MLPNEAKKKRDELAKNCAQDCGLTLGTDQANALITGYQLGFEEGIAYEQQTLNKQMEKFADKINEARGSNRWR